jgi:phosphatidate cytidylyltransferase
MLISNPVASPYWAPALALLSGVLSGSLLLLLAGYRDWRRLRASELFRRWLVWAALGPVFILAVLGGALPVAGLLALAVGQGLREYTRLVALPAPYRRVLPALGVLTVAAALLSREAFAILPPLLLLIGTLQPVLGARQAAGVRHLAFTALGWGYVAWFLAHALLLYRDMAGGQGLLLSVGVGTALSDVGAFVAGSRLGGPRLAPAISPHKTWAGVGGHLLGAALGVGLTAFALPPEGGLLLFGLPLLIAGGAVWGDLLESRLKREFGVKDAGAWLPGFGGLLDRLDSLILVVPLVFYTLRLLNY